MTSKNDHPAEPSADREIVISRVFDAPRELVWQAMTDPERVILWWGPRGFTTTIKQMDVRPGGVWKLVMHGPDGVDYPNFSVFTEVVKPERLAYSHGGARKGGPSAQFQATWSFDALDDGKTRLTMRMVFPSAEARDTIVREYGAIEGGKQTLERLSEELAKTPFVIEHTFNAPIAIVWSAITEKDQMKQWSFENLDSFKPEVGFETQFNVRMAGRDYLHLWRVTKVTPGTFISYSWKYGGFPGDSLVTFELSAEGDKTRLRLTHEGLETFLPETNPDLARGNFVKGWTSLIGSSLNQFLETAASSPH